MFFKDYIVDTNYFIADDDFVSVKYDGPSITYSICLYGRLIQALIDEYDDVKISLMTGGQFKTKYFRGETKELIDLSNTDFIQHSKEELKKHIEARTIAEKIIPVSSLIPDEIVSMIGSKKITTDNYVNHLPAVDLIDFNILQKKITNSTVPDIESFQSLSMKLFQKYGIFPGEVSNINFPAKMKSKNGDGATSKKSSTSKKLMKNVDFSDYYENYYKSQTSIEIQKIEKNKKAKYQKFIVDIPILLSTPQDVIKYTTHQKLFVRVGLFKSGVEVNSTLFSFANNDAYQEATAGVENVDSKIITHDPRYVLPDVIEIQNNEIFPVETTLFEFSIGENNKFEKKQILKYKLNPKSGISVPARKIYFEKSESRAYAVTANKYIPGIAGVSNVLSILRPPATTAPPKSPGKLSLNVLPGNNDDVTLTLLGLKSSEYIAKVFRTDISGLEKKYIGNINFSNSKLTDDTIVPGEFYIYEAEIEMNGAGKFGKTSTCYISLFLGGISRIDFDIKEERSRRIGNGKYSHTFKIIENVSTTTAEKLLETVNSSGEAGKFASELETIKQSATVITSYVVYRANTTSGEVFYLGEHSSGKTLRFAVNKSADQNAAFKYYILPKVSETGAISYKTIVEETDVASGKLYKYSYKKWRDKNYNRAELLPSFSEVIKDDIANALLNLPEGIAKTCSFNPGTTQGTISRLSILSRQNSSCAFVSWKYSGSLENILYFVVMASYNGFKAPIGLSIPDVTDSRRALYSYCDEKLGSVLGEVKYSIIPVLLNGSRGPESPMIKVDSVDNYPGEALL